MRELPEHWYEALLAVLLEGNAAAKASLAERVLAARDGFDLARPPVCEPPVRPARPSKPELLPFNEVPRRSIGSERGRKALLHALAHIELNAVDLAADMALRFAGDVADDLRAAFVSDWIGVMGEEGLHFRILSERMAALGLSYGDLPAHDGLWDAARATADSLLGRLAVAPMILEARGLDVTPGLIDKLSDVNDNATAKTLTRIYEDEIGHVRTGVNWFRILARGSGDDPEVTFHKCVMKYYPTGPKPPFNVGARSDATFPRDWYEGVLPQ